MAAQDSRLDRCRSLAGQQAVGGTSSSTAGFEAQWGVFSAGAILGAIPPVIIFFFAQRYIAGGLLAGAVKG